ncbi:MAG: DUF4387 domain-containing protein [SAR202 cluster bacterium]|jgi:hypothetical protein|nr:DUF4387 domain-containing protein [SAR202 cluster bacterium]|tara:strand:+ start:584 stop:901 length:318 start_codon:yes stop_codon:yes gene_type:complete
MGAAKLKDLASTIRSKNAGVDHITFDIIFRNRGNFERVRDSDVITRHSMAKLYGIEPERVVDFSVFEPGNAIKFTIRRRHPSGSPGEHDVYGTQQYAPLFYLEIP